MDTGLTPRLKVVAPESTHHAWIGFTPAVPHADDDEDRVDLHQLEPCTLSDIVGFILPQSTDGRSTQKDTLKLRATSKQLKHLARAVLRCPLSQAPPYVGTAVTIFIVEV